MTETVSQVTDPALLAAARAGEEAAFEQLIAPYRRELHVHCYRMLGSFEDADDALQETLLRVWRHLATWEPTATLRAWLYRISTNVCLDALKQRTRRNEFDTSTLPPYLMERDDESMRLDPYPDRLIDELSASIPGPEATVELRESVELAFVSAVQLLPPRQRAALLLRDVIGYPANEVANLLETSAASVNSALQRARATLTLQRERGPITRAHAPRDAATEQVLIRKLVDAFQNANISDLVATLSEDAVLSMPPIPARYEGKVAIGNFFAQLAGDRPLDRFRFVPTGANCQPALATYFQEEVGGPFIVHGVLVLAIAGDRISGMVRFGSDDIFETFGMPRILPD